MPTACLARAPRSRLARLTYLAPRLARPLSLSGDSVRPCTSIPKFPLQPPPLRGPLSCLHVTVEPTRFWLGCVRAVATPRTAILRDSNSSLKNSTACTVCRMTCSKVTPTPPTRTNTYALPLMCLRFLLHGILYWPEQRRSHPTLEFHGMVLLSFRLHREHDSNRWLSWNLTIIKARPGARLHSTSSIGVLFTRESIEKFDAYHSVARRMVGFRPVGFRPQPEVSYTATHSHPVSLL